MSRPLIRRSSRIMTDHDYTPIACSLYDQLEILSMRKTEITLLPNMLHIEPPYLITNLYPRDGVEYMLINDRAEIRLDSIDSIDGSVILLHTGLQEEE